MTRFPLVAVIVGIVGLVLALIVGYAIAEEQYLVVMGVSAIGCGMLAIVEPRLLSAGVIMLYYSGLTLPPIIGKLNLFHIATAALFGAVVFRYAFDKSLPLIWSRAHSWLFAFGLVILATVLFRGAGLKVLGDDKWGGMFYVQLFLCMTLVVTLPRLPLPVPVWRPVLALALLAAFLPAIAGFLMIRSGAFAGALGGFIQADAQVQLSLSAQATGGVVRQTALAGAGQSLFNTTLLYFPIAVLFSGAGWLGMGIVGISFLLVGFSGYRTALISMVLTAGVLLVWTKSLNFNRILVAGLVFVLFYAGALLFSTSLPPAVQRMLSILPGVEVEGYVEQDANSTVDWRLKLWERGIQKIPEYWLLGKGYAFSGRELLAAQEKLSGLFDPTDWAVVNSSYHQGILSLLVGLGLPGLITGMGMFILFVQRHMAFQKQQWSHPVLKLCHQVLTAYLIVGLIKYVFIYGDVQASFPEYFYVIGILESMWVTNLTNRRTASVAASKSSVEDAAVVR